MQSPQLCNDSYETSNENFNENEISYDIFECFPILYCQNVFKYLTTKDLLEASCVSKQWNDFVGESSQMKRLKLVFTPKFKDNNGLRCEKALTDEDKKILKKSKRKYQNIFFHEIPWSDVQFCLEFLASRAGSWKSVHIIDQNLRDSVIWDQIFDIIEPTVEELLIYARVSRDRPRMSFSRLKSLKCEAHMQNIYEHFVDCRNLTQFHWIFRDATDFEAVLSNFSPDVIEILHNNPGLEDIQVNSQIMKPENDFKFKLKKLCVTRETQLGFDVPENLAPFLQNHAQTLESLTVLTSFNESSLEVVLAGMPRLTSITMDYFIVDDTVFIERPLPVNSTITSLDLNAACYGDVEEFGILVAALHVLKQFRTDFLDDLLLDALAKNAHPPLEIIEVELFRATRLPEGDYFPNIKKLDDFKERLRITTEENKLARLVIEKWKMENHPDIECDYESE